MSPECDGGGGDVLGDPEVGDAAGSAALARHHTVPQLRILRPTHTVPSPHLYEGMDRGHDWEVNRYM
jgi:hypothetical protein